MCADTKTCQGQHEGLLGWTEATAYPSRVYKLVWQWKSRGLRAALRTTLVRIRRFFVDRRASPHGQAIAGSCAETLSLRPGEWVRVRPEREILATLDACGRNKGLAWIPCMGKHCGKEYRVYKRVERIILESTGEIRKARNTVLLDGVICDGLYGCDRSCFPFWREAWLERVPGSEDA
jgi:hypothetical protein